MNDDTVLTWKGRDVRELTRDELIEALRVAAELYNQSLRDALMRSKVMVPLR